MVDSGRGCIARRGGLRDIARCAALHGGPHPGAGQVSDARGPLSREKSAAIVAELKRKSGDVDILQKHAALEQAIVGTPLVAGNSRSFAGGRAGDLSRDAGGHSRRQNHINFETYIIEDDETGRQFADLLLARQAAGVQVHLIYDSVGCIRTPREFFERLKDGGVQVLELNPVNPLTARRAGRSTTATTASCCWLTAAPRSSAASTSATFIRAARSSRVPRTSSPKSGGLARHPEIQIDGPVVAGIPETLSGNLGKAARPAAHAGKLFPRIKSPQRQRTRAQHRQLV